MEFEFYMHLLYATVWKPIAFVGLKINSQLISDIYCPTHILIKVRGVPVDHWSTISSLFYGREHASEIWINIILFFLREVYFDGLVQDCSNSIGNALELLQSRTKQSICCVICQMLALCECVYGLMSWDCLHKSGMNFLWKEFPPLFVFFFNPGTPSDHWLNPVSYFLKSPPGNVTFMRFSHSKRPLK